ncbi:unnamed protein product [Brachionus calyciflorus]|uniref:CDGSH iron-sulfur domain-containing protein 2 homologue n=1 Tax=Brachionus calyciflorus TaxID=104777 RepID=A0A813R0Z2_9BILA|nr:unnamed protein product [Brachionus calyciflorus]
MELFSNFFNEKVANYFSGLPLPRSFGEITSLSLKDFLRLVPFFTSLGLVGYVSYKEVNDYLNRKQLAWVNKDYCKSKNKIADIISRQEVNEAIEKNGKVVYCRCWKSKTFPYCDGTHAKHNAETGDNVGPLVFKE